MTEQNDPTTPEGAPAGQQPGPGAVDAEAASAAGEGAKGREWLAQLQAMIDDLATQAAPTVRQVGAKAAELAAVAGEKAGPIAQRAAEITGEAGQKLAERSRHLAEELRRDLPGGGDATPVEPRTTGPDEAASPADDAPETTPSGDEPSA